MQNKSECELLEIIDSSSVGSFICDMENGEIFYSHEWSKRLGIDHLSPREAMSVSNTHVHPEDRERMNMTFLKACEEKSSKIRVEFRAKTVDSGYIWILGQGKIIFNEYGKPIKYYGTHSDITEQKKAEEEIKRYVEELRKKEEEELELIDGSTEGTWIVDRLTGTIKCSERWAKKIGLDIVPIEEQLEYTHRLANPDDTAGGNSIEHCMEIGAERFNLEYRIKTNDNKYIWTQNRGKIIYNDQGEPVKVYAATSDITDRKNVEKALRDSERKAMFLVSELEEADRNKNAFINMLSHELRNPIASITMGLDLMEKMPQGGKKAMSALKIAKRQCKHLVYLVDDLLDATRATQNKIEINKEIVELNELIKKSVEDYQSQFNEKGVKLDVRLTSPIFMEADPYRITQVIGNLLHNAAKYTRNNDQVTVSVTEDSNINEAIIVVHDTGRGIAPEVIGNIFEMFTQADKSLDRSLGGLGLGLAIVKGIVELHKGKVEAFSEGIDKGSKFTIRLPLM